LVKKQEGTNLIKGAGDRATKMFSGSSSGKTKKGRQKANFI